MRFLSFAGSTSTCSSPPNDCRNKCTVHTHARVRISMQPERTLAASWTTLACTLPRQPTAIASVLERQTVRAHRKPQDMNEHWTSRCVCACACLHTLYIHTETYNAIVHVWVQYMHTCIHATYLHTPCWVHHFLPIPLSLQAVTHAQLWVLLTFYNYSFTCKYY